MRGRRYALRWRVGSLPYSEARFEDFEGLYSALNRAMCDGIEFSRYVKGDLYTYPTTDDPLLLQFAVGHPWIATLFWHNDGECMAAVEPGIRLQSGFGSGGGYEQPDEAHLPDLRYSRLRPSTLRDALAVYVLTDQRAAGLHWSVMPGD